MKDIVIGIDEFTDSRELMTAKAKPFVNWLIYIIFGIVAAFFLWASFAQTEEYVSVSGMVRPSEEVSNVKFPASGTIKTVNVKDGQTVKAGDILFEINADTAKQENLIEKEQLNTTEAQIIATGKLIDSVQAGENLFDANDVTQASYILKYDDYVSNIKSVKLQYQNSSSDNELTKNDAQATLDYARKTAKTVSDSLQDYKILYASVNSGINKFSDITSACAKSFSSYKSKYNDLEQTLKSDRQKLQESTSELSTGNVTSQAVDALKSAVSADQSNLDTLKQEMLSSTQSSIDQLGSQLDEANLTISKANDALDNVSAKQSGENIAIEKLKFDTLSQYYDNLTTLRQNEAALKNQIYQLENTVNQSVVKAGIGGKVSMSSAIIAGDLAVAGNEVLYIVPQTKTNDVTLYVPESDISHFKAGGSVKYQINALPYTEYGEAGGKILSISPDVTTDSTSGKSYYTVKSELSTTVLKSYKGETGQIKTGMVCKAKTVYGTKSVLMWIMEKLDFWD